jgi:sarcosine oxidase delta subunit
MVSENVKKEIEAIIEEYLAKKKSEKAVPKEQISDSQTERQKEQSIKEPDLLTKLLQTSSPTEEGQGVQRNFYSYSDQPSQSFLVQLNTSLYDKAKEEASKRQLSLASYFRESLLFRLNKSSLKNKTTIDNLLRDCTTIENGQRRLVLEGEQGFINQVAQRGLTGSVWTFSEIDKIAFILAREHGRSLQEKCIEAMKLDKVQTQYFRVSMFVAFEEKTEEGFYMPHGICDNCHRPLTRDQYSMSGCPYCGNTKGREFQYDNEVISETLFNPYAMCSNMECRRPLPREAKKWKCCPFCGNEEKIALNYEGISENPKPAETMEKEETDSEEAEESEEEEL